MIAIIKVTQYFVLLLSPHLSFPLKVHHVDCQKHKLKFDELEKSAKV